MGVAMSKNVPFEFLPIDEKFKSIFEEYRRQVQEQVLFDVLSRFYFADWTRSCDYERMTPGEVVGAAMSVCKKIEDQYNYTIDNDLYY
jgi:hypothetical protein